MKKVARMDVELTVMERSLLSVGYKNNIGTKRTLMRTLLSIEQEEEARRNCEYVKIVKDYRQRVEKDLSKICNDILSIIAIHLLPSSSSGESIAFYYRACHLAKQTVDEAFSNIFSLPEDSYKDCTAILQLLRDNLILWTSDFLEEGEIKFMNDTMKQSLKIEERSN
ncbi:14-3-3 protein 7 [Acorus calamus]|uniref:14-3-3 protein 7 n=1 Tax=Acorus calamus TaxID=4465 RepID=A0AAV9DQ15_ACOCL|nr:14-3-3 protein 7 [Acorus calamus]